MVATDSAFLTVGFSPGAEFSVICRWRDCAQSRFLYALQRHPAPFGEYTVALTWQVVKDRPAQSTVRMSAVGSFSRLAIAS